MFFSNDLLERKIDELKVKGIPKIDEKYASIVYGCISFIN